MTSRAKRQILLFVFFLFLQEKTPERTRNCEDVSSQTPVFRQKIQTLYHFLTNWKAKLWGRLKPNVRFWNVTIDSTTVLVCKIVRTSQAKRPFFNFFKQKKGSEIAKLWGRLSPNARSWKIWSVFLSIFSLIWARSRPRNCEDVSGKSSTFVF